MLLLTLSLISKFSQAATGEAGLFSIGPGFKVLYAIDADYSFASTAITNRLGLEYFKKGFISDEMKDDVSANLFRTNRFAAEFNSGITVAQSLDTIFGLLKGSSFIRLSTRAHIDSKFEDDLFEIFFRGNKNYAGKTAMLRANIAQVILLPAVHIRY